MQRESSSNVSADQGRPDCSSCQRCGQKTTSDDEAGGGDEGREAGSVDGLSAGSRVGQKGQMSRPLRGK